MASISTAPLLTELVSLWHAHRIELLFVGGLLLLAFRFSSFTKHKKIPKISQESSDSKSQVAIATQPQVANSRPKLAGPKRFTGSRQGKTQSPAVAIDLVVFYFSLGGSTAKLAEDLVAAIDLEATPLIRKPVLHNLVEIDFDELFISPPKPPQNARQYYLLLLPTYNIDTELNLFIDSLAETHNDFRIDTGPLRELAGYSVFGFGDKEQWPTEAEGYCSQATEVDRWMARLTGKKRAFPVGMADVKTGAKSALNEWMEGVLDGIRNIADGKGLGEGVEGSGDAVESDEEEEDDVIAEADLASIKPVSLKKRSKAKTPAIDLEDIRGPSDDQTEIDFTTTTIKPSAPKEMVPENSPTYTALTKQGYTIVGSHSGVKLCRWTKSALRGRGSCYKFSFYGIKSHQCMETTPSLSCSNKCVFCWRHGTNPVSTTWRWTVDPADLIFQGVKANHYKKIKAMRGVPGVRAERFAEGMRIRHCALSLVGEPIFYPHINELLGMLHSERISTFLVCNAQHPDQLAALTHVTQLYVSIDASNKEALKKIDRPLHRDYWERFLRCMDILREKRNMQRTVFRLTLVKGFNIDEEAEGYADLVERARPGLVEVKGVTYCGTSTSAAAGLTMQNVPFYEEVCAFVEALNRALERRGLGYGIAAEHAHSCCILLAEKERFYKEDGWHTLIDYEKFFDNLESGKEFGPEDYVGPPTPEWALWGKGGFDPRDERVDRKGRKKEGLVTVGGGNVVSF
ncbi:hypothetical protein K461DRAFT_323661 [Myriangium duriaei CBS 260.36]|uniref:tRNA 4-demethylwyosine synthase (AdoMet-dependent) n=1 Tax=Myriangium duriaei CBS 260.36 TaxID=1168546 RepID=A0A9P4IXE5_9PEZI|nr:hypothetical protein K461DRAFT_323661 [Myriangium duriaei CBS 260.36]